MQVQLASGRQFKTVFALAQAHLKHEWVLTLCLIAALAAVMAPLLILMGLKEGVVSTLRNRLVEDPVFREIRPAITRQYDNDWLEKYRQDARVGFLVPSILPASSIVYAISHQQSEKTPIKKMLDLIPTVRGDVLLLENDSAVPGEGECVLTHSAAAQLKVSVGEKIAAQVTRNMHGRAQSVSESLKVISVLPERANSVAAIYTPLAFVEDVEAYKEGRHVAKRGWQGEVPYPHMSFNGIFVFVPEELDSLTANALAINTGLHQVDAISRDNFLKLSGLSFPEGWHGYHLSTVSGDITISSVKAVKRKARGRNAVVLPYAKNIVLRQGSSQYSVFGLSLDKSVTDKLGWITCPWGKLNPKNLQMNRLLQIVMSRNVADKADDLFDLQGSELKGMPLEKMVTDKNTPVLIPVELMGMLNTAKRRAVRYDKTQSALILEKSGYRGFRLYAKSIDDVPELVENFRINEDLEVIAEVGAIQRIQVLDKGLTRLFWLIAVLGIVGAIAVLTASLYAAVERETKNLGILRLLGLSRTDVFWFPVFQGLTIAMIGTSISILCYGVLSLIINYTFGHELPGDEAICRLPYDYFVVAFLAVIALSCISSFLAAWKATNIETAEAIREE